jgi:hypothetical protein
MIAIFNDLFYRLPGIAVPDSRIWDFMVNQEKIFSELNEGMLEERSRAFRYNLRKNLPLIRQNGGLKQVVNEFRDMHVIVIGSGPSLDSLYGILEVLQRRRDIILLAADMALKSLVERGIKPHYVITCETTPSEFFTGINTSGIHLLAFSCSSFSNLRKWQGRISFYNWMISGEFYMNLWAEAGKDLGSVATGSIVTTQAVSMVLGCGVASLLLAGNDMGFFDKFYASGAVSAEKKYFISSRINSPETIEMIRGRKARVYEIRRDDMLFYTNNQFLAAKLWLENLFRQATYPVADCSVPGCSAGTVLKITPDDYFAVFNRRDSDKEAL